MMDFFTDDRLWQALPLALFVGAVLAVGAYMLGRADPFRALMLDTDPVKRTVPGTGLAAWESGPLGPRDSLSAVAPEVARHVVAAEGDRVALRTGAYRHRWQLFLALGLCAPMVGLGVLVFAERFLNFAFSGGQRCFYFVEDRVESVALSGSIPAFLREIWCTLTFTLDPAYSFASGWGQVAAAFGRAEVWSLALTLLGLGLFAYLRMRPDPAPLLVDRKRRIVATRRGERILAARWDGARISAVKGAGRTASLAIALHPLTPDGSWGTATEWVHLSGWSGARPWRWERMDGAWDEWDRVRLGITAWMDGILAVPDAPGPRPALDAPFDDLPTGPYASVDKAPHLRQILEACGA
ncbi:MAG: hypothetical protein AAGK98_05325 [Pseudomonadota bacterium]